jgi:hypothetical protein
MKVNVSLCSVLLDNSFYLADSGMKINVMTIKFIDIAKTNRATYKKQSKPHIHYTFISTSIKYNLNHKMLINLSTDVSHAH